AGSGRVDGDHLRPADGNPVGVLATGDGLRLWGHVLAPIARLAGGRSVEADPPSTAHGTPPGGRDRLVARRDRQLQCAGVKRGAQTGPNPTDRGRPGSKHHILTEAQGVPLVVTLT